MIRRIVNLTAVALLGLALSAPAMATEPEIDEEAVLQALEERDPSTYEDLLRLRETSLAAYRSRLQAAHGKMVLREEHPEWFEAEDRIQELEHTIDRRIAVFRNATEDEQASIYDELLDLTGEMQERRLDSYRLRIELLRLRLADLERQVRAREEERDEFNRRWLDRRLERQD